MIDHLHSRLRHNLRSSGGERFSDQEVRQMESLYGSELPEDYSQLIEDHGAVALELRGGATMDFYGGDLVLEISTEKVFRDMYPNSIVIASDRGGNKFVLSDAGVHVIDWTVMDGALFVADSLTSMLVGGVGLDSLEYDSEFYDLDPEAFDEDD